MEWEIEHSGYSGRLGNNFVHKIDIVADLDSYVLAKTLVNNPSDYCYSL